MVYVKHERTNCMFTKLIFWLQCNIEDTVTCCEGLDAMVAYNIQQYMEP